jgi:hypothetical protein
MRQFKKCMRAALWTYLVCANLWCAGAPSLAAQDENALPQGLPNPLVFASGKPVTSAKQWSSRRVELLHLFTLQMYGQMPQRPHAMRFKVYERDQPAFGGKATRTQVAILLNGHENGPRIELLLYAPIGIKKPAVILGMNFWGNEMVSKDPGIRISANWVESFKSPMVDLTCVSNHHATEGCRGMDASRWPVEKILSHGYALATFYRGDLDPDRKDGFAQSVRSGYPELQKGDDNFSTIGAWAWGLSRALDFLQSDGRVDGHRVVVFGWSRLGKAAIWAGATDPRFAAVISNESGAGGAKLFRHGQGETIERLNDVFPDWFCRNFRQFNGEDTRLPFDQHEVLALIAPRPLYVASAMDDKNSDPLGEFLSAKAVRPVYILLGKSGLPVERWPPVDTPALGVVSYHVRTGGHDVTDYDWDQYLRFCDRFVTNGRSPARTGAIH